MLRIEEVEDEMFGSLVEELVKSAREVEASGVRGSVGRVAGCGYLYDADLTCFQAEVERRLRLAAPFRPGETAYHEGYGSNKWKKKKVIEVIQTEFGWAIITEGDPKRYDANHFVAVPPKPKHE